MLSTSRHFFPRNQAFSLIVAGSPPPPPPPASVCAYSRSGNFRQDLKNLVRKLCSTQRELTLNVFVCMYVFQEENKDKEIKLNVYVYCSFNAIEIFIIALYIRRCRYDFKHAIILILESYYTKIRLCLFT